MKKLIITILIIGVAIASFFIRDLFVQDDTEGTITIIIIDEDGNELHHDDIVIEEGDSLLSIMDEQYNLQCASIQYQPTDCDNVPMFGHVILEIDTIETDWLNTYIAIFVNDSYSNNGIDDIPLTSDTTYRFEYTVVEEDDNVN